MSGCIHSFTHHHPLALPTSVVTPIPYSLDGACPDLDDVYSSLPLSLVSEGANVNYYDPEMLQATALHWAANNGHEDTVEKLIELGASVMPTNQVGRLAE